MALVAMEQSLPENKRIVNDDLALRILPLGYRVEVKLMKPITKWIIKKSEQKVPGLWGSIMSRKRYIDDRVSEYADGRIDAIVNLGAGFDTRSLRLPALAQVPTWEVDQVQNINAKRARIEKLFQPAPQHLNLVEIDFDHQDLGTVLTSNGYSPEMKTFFIWEGVTQYVTESGIRATFQFLARAAPGSRLVFTYTPKDFIDGGNFYGQEYLYKQMLVRDQIWLFGIDPVEVEGFIGEYGWRVVEHLGYDDLVERYVAPTGRNLQSMDIERVVLAEKG
jgi:methyltransferase (TIGR00027 family)